MEKRFLFVNLDIRSGYDTGENHGIAYLVPIVKKHSYRVACLNIRNELSDKEFINKIADFNPSIVTFSSTSNQLKFLIKYSKTLEKYPEILSIAGGVGPTLDPDWILSRNTVRGVCIGEGDIPLDNLLNNIENEKNIFDTEGFHWNVAGKIKRNPVPQFIPDLSIIPFPDYSVFDRNVVLPSGNLVMMLSRRCPYNCFYCCNKALSNVYPSSKGLFRVPSVEHSIRILEKMIEQYPEAKSIIFEDDLLITNKTWFENFAEEYRKRINIPYRICVRVECVTPDIIKALKRSGCRRVSIGLESGNEHIRKNVLNRKHSNSLITKKSKMIKDAGFELFTFNIVGFPSEGKEEMKDTLKLNETIGPNLGVCTFFYPYKGTDLYKICKDNDLLKPEEEMVEITNYNTRPSIKMTASQQKNCIHFQKKITAYLGAQYELTKIVHLPLPPGIKKCFAATHYWVKYWAKSILSKTPLLYNMVKKIYKSLE